jgi:hypothetical protein
MVVWEEREDVNDPAYQPTSGEEGNTETHNSSGRSSNPTLGELPSSILVVSTTESSASSLLLLLVQLVLLTLRETGTRLVDTVGRPVCLVGVPNSENPANMVVNRSRLLAIVPGDDCVSSCLVGIMVFDEIDEGRKVIEMLEMDPGTRPCGGVCCV